MEVEFQAGENLHFHCMVDLHSMAVSCIKHGMKIVQTSEFRMVVLVVLIAWTEVL